jgi:hypothetical protein
MEPLELLPRGTLAALELAIEEAAAWRGACSHDPDALAEHDAQIKRMRAALAAVRKQQRAIRYMMSLAAAREGVSGENSLH